MSIAKRILVVRSGALGDLILTLPAIDRIRKDNPDAHITIAGNVEFLSLLHNTYVDDILSFESPLLRPYFLESEPKLAAGAPLPFDLAYVWLRNPHDPFVTNLRRCGISVKSAASVQTEETFHQADFLYAIHNSDQASGPGLSGDSPTRLALSRGNGHRRVMADSTRRRIALHPGAGSLRKRWPVEQYQALARELQKENEIYWIEGPAEIEKSTVTEKVGHVIHSDIVRLAHFLETIDLFIGNDSGVTHLAQALGTESIALFGPTNPNIWAPRGSKVLHSPGPESQPAAQLKDVLDLVSGLLSMKGHDTHC